MASSGLTISLSLADGSAPHLIGLLQVERQKQQFGHGDQIHPIKSNVVRTRKPFEIRAYTAMGDGARLISREKMMAPHRKSA